MLKREVSIDLANFGTKELSNFEILGINKLNISIQRPLLPKNLIKIKIMIGET